MITRLHHVQITVPPGREADARRFYCELLGLPEIPKPESLRGRGGLWVRVGDRQVHIGVEEGVDRPATKAHLAYEVTDLASWRRRLAAAGIQPLEGAPIPGWERLEFRDPFGNRVELLQHVRHGDVDPDRIRELEELAANAWPAGVQQALDGWRLRYHLGVTRRANSALCLEDAGRLPLPVKLEAMEDFYLRRGLPPRFQMTAASLPLELDAELETRGYLIPDRTRVMAAAASDIPPLPEGDDLPAVRFREQLFPEWAQAYGLSEGLSREKVRARRSILERIGPQAAFFYADFADNSPERGFIPPALGLGILERGWAGIFCMATRPEFRRRGLASAIVKGIAGWARSHGAEALYLQVAEENSPAVATYEKLGFVTEYEYWYRELARRD